jgi:23S rRNA (guanine2445-N2)-methyltransferase / 23S rRNA (guanine2069-N7)-methyltransferase
LCIDLSGSSLHQRGYRKQTGEAPLKENFAAALLHRAGWQSQDDAAEPLAFLLDPMCGSGTLVIEAALMAYDIAPGSLREYWGFLGWKPFQSAHWQAALEEAARLKSEASERVSVQLFASDHDPKVLDMARENARRAGVESLIEWQVTDFKQGARPNISGRGLVITNPPYGERLEDSAKAEQIYSELGSWLRSQFRGDKAAVLSTQKGHGHALKIRAEKIYRFKNGPIECELLKLDLQPEHFVESKRQSAERWDEALSDSARMLANRIQKNLASLKGFIHQQQLSCYRVYDADLPEYAAAIDLYKDALHIQEYAPPKTIDAHKAMRRLRDIERVAAGVLNISPDRVFVKTRMRQKGDTQYRRQDEQRQVVIVEEGRCRFEVNLSDYLDTGLFLDHRKIRQQMAQWIKPGMMFLNLFCYTGTASVHTAKAGARTVNVDLSNTYLEWARRNFVLNDLPLTDHEFIRADTMEWLAENQNQREHSFDIIFIDPPTFSNSKKMEHHFDVQQAHQTLLQLALRLLKPGGRLVFSNNFKRFEMTFEAPQDVSMKEITRETTSRDFSRKPLHRCWLLQKSS